MGRGLGTVQRRVLATLATLSPEPSWTWTTAEVTAALYGEHHTDSQRRGVARAVSTLAARGSVLTELSARRFREVTSTRPFYIPHYLDPEDGKWHGGRFVQMTEHRRVPVPEVLVRLRRTDSAAMDAAIANEPRTHNSGSTV